MKALILSLLTAASISLNAQTTRDTVIDLNPYLSLQNYEHFKRLVLSSPNSNIEFLDSFDFCWGYNYKISVKETALEENLSDGTSFYYSINKIISKTKVHDSTQFKLFLTSKRYYYEIDPSELDLDITIRPINDTTFLYFEEVEIEVPQTLRTKFKLIFEGKKNQIGTFVFLDDKRIRLVEL